MTQAQPTRDELAQLYEADRLNLEAIGQRYGVSRKLVTRWLKEGGIAIRKAERGVKVEPPPVEELRKLRADGLSLDEVAQRFGVARTTAHRWYKEAGIKQQRGRKPTDTAKAQFVAYHRQKFLEYLRLTRAAKVGILEEPIV